MLAARRAGAAGEPGPGAAAWSLGCLLWEAISLGGTPYPGLPGRDLLVRISRGLRLPRPPGTPDQVAQLLLSCWMTDPADRPDPGEVRATLLECAASPDTNISFSLPGPHFQYEQYIETLEFTAE